MKPESSYQIPAGDTSREISRKKSRFIGTLRRVRSLAEMREFYGEMQKLHPKANHNCWAAVAGAPGDAQAYGFSDDGEPNGTAGKPILNVLRYAEIGQAGLVVTRHFGGVKLGTGGLVRAYTETAQLTLEAAVLRRFSPTVKIRCTLPYEQEGEFRYILKQFKPQEETFSYAELVTAELLIDEERSAQCLEMLKGKLGHVLKIAAPDVPG